MNKFVLVIPSFGAILIGTVDKENFRAWSTRQQLLVLQEPKRLIVEVTETQPGDQHSQVGMLKIAPAYPGDTPQETMYLDQASVEVIGDVEDVGNGQERCETNNRLFQTYKKVCKEWRMSRSNLVAPSPLDVANINNISRLPKRT
jgi:hypothetical protein